MRQRLTKSIPPWELASRLVYRRRKALSAGKEVSRTDLYNLFNHCTKAIARRQEVHQEENGTVPSDVSVTRESDPDLPSWKMLEDVNIKLQHLSLVGLNKRDRRVLIEFVKRIEPFLNEPSTVFKFLCSISSVVNVRSKQRGPGIKWECNAAFESLFRRLSGQLNPYEVVTCYLKLCSFYGQKVTTLSSIYHSMVAELASGDTFITEKEMDDLLFLYERLAICDKRILEYYSNRISRHFECFSENQICNFARYLVTSVYASCSPGVIGASPDYSKQFNIEETTTLLDGFNVNSSVYLRCLEAKLPICLHQYTYFNLIDMGEFYHVFDIQSDVRMRFSTELWKYLYTLKYGYPIKSLVVLSKLGLGDTKTFGRLIRNIPQTLAFRWPLSLVTECLINLEGAKKEKIYVILAHYISKRISATFPGHNVARIFESLRNKRIALLGLYQKVLNIQATTPEWLTTGQLFTIARYAKDTGFSVQQVVELLKTSDLSDLDPQNAVTLLDMVSTMDPTIVKMCVQTLADVNNTAAIGFESLMELLKACRRLNMRLSFVQQLAVVALEPVETIETNVMIQLIELLGACGPLDDQSLMEKLESYIYQNLGNLPLRRTGQLLWHCFAMGMAMNSRCFQELLRNFNKLYDSSYNEDQLLQVLAAAMMKLDTQHSEMRKFLRNMENFKDVSWRRNATEIARIRDLEQTVKCKTFVSVFPFTADAEIELEELRNYIVKAGELQINPEGCDVLDRQLNLSMEQGEYSVYLDLCRDPFVSVVDQAGRITLSLSFYHQMRNRLVGKPFLHLVNYNS